MTIKGITTKAESHLQNCDVRSYSIDVVDILFIEVKDGSNLTIGEDCFVLAYVLGGEIQKKNMLIASEKQNNNRNPSLRSYMKSREIVTRKSNVFFSFVTHIATSSASYVCRLGLRPV